jgi:hypothetical protein
MLKEQILELLACKPIKTAKLKADMIKNEFADNIRTADRLVAKWLRAGDLKRIGLGERDFKVIYKEYHDEYERERLRRLL